MFGPWTPEIPRSAANSRSSASANRSSSSKWLSVSPSGGEVRVKVPEDEGERRALLLVTVQLTVYTRSPMAVHLMIGGTTSSTCLLHGTLQVTLYVLCVTF